MATQGILGHILPKAQTLGKGNLKKYMYIYTHIILYMMYIDIYNIE